VRIKPRDDRNDIPAAQLETIAVTVARLSRFTKQTPPAARSCAASMAALEQTRKVDHIICESLAELALRYVLGHGVIALPRLHRHEHVLDALTASVLPPLPAELIEILEELDF
jgi:diketogulonate reductase-like aldo/keto reductase